MNKHILSLAVLLLSVVAQANDTATSVGYQQALQALKDGNERYVSGQPQEWDNGQAKRELLAKGQHPLACVITCSDSRVSPEILFDQAIGDIFVVRLAGNIVSLEAAGSIEYAVSHLGASLVVVLGHSACGAVGAAIANPELSGSVGSIVAQLQPAVQAARMKGYADAELPMAVATENARHGVDLLMQNSRAVDEGVKLGHVAVCSATYDLATGATTWHTQTCAPESKLSETHIAKVETHQADEASHEVHQAASPASEEHGKKSKRREKHNAEERTSRH